MIKGIYLTEESKKELEAKIAELEESSVHHDGIVVSKVDLAKCKLLEEILSSAIILPVEKSWKDSLDRTEVTDCIYANKLYYPQGVIIQPK